MATGAGVWAGVRGDEGRDMDREWGCYKNSALGRKGLKYLEEVRIWVARGVNFQVLPAHCRFGGRVWPRIWRECRRDVTAADHAPLGSG